MKKTLCLLMITVLCTSLIFTGCSQGQKKVQEKDALQLSTALPENSLVTAPGQMPVVKDKYTLKVFAGRDTAVADLEKNEFTDWYEKTTNVHVVWDQVPQSQAKEKTNIILASGDLPDVFMNAQVSNTQVLLYGSQGVFIPLNDLINKYSIHFKTALQKSPYVLQDITAPNGKIYGVPRVNECYHCTANSRLWIDTTWLKKLNMKMPETTDDFYEVMKAFKTKDPNGNGKADEIPLTSYNTSYHLDSFLMSAFIYNDNNHPDAPYMELNNGKLKFVANTPEWKQGLQYMRKLYDEKLIAPESFTQDINQLKQQGEAPTAVLGTVATWAFLDFTVNFGESGRYLEYETIPPLKGPSGVRWAVNRPFSAPPTHAQITNKCKNPEVAMRWLDYFYSFEGTVSGGAGVEGLAWEKVKPGENPWITMKGEPALHWPIKRDKEKVAYGNLQTTQWAATAPCYKYQELREGSPIFNIKEGKDSAETFRTYHEYRFWKYVKEGFEPYKKKEVVPSLMYTEQQASRAAELKTTITKYIQSSTAKFITGQLDVSKDWDSYTKELDRMGTAEYIKLIQEVYDARKK